MIWAGWEAEVDQVLEEEIEASTHEDGGDHDVRRRCGVERDAGETVATDDTDEPSCGAEECGDEQRNGVSMLVGLAPWEPEGKVCVPDEPDGIEACAYGCGSERGVVGVDVVGRWLSHCAEVGGTRIVCPEAAGVQVNVLSNLTVARNLGRNVEQWQEIERGLPSQCYLYFIQDRSPRVERPWIHEYDPLWWDSMAKLPSRVSVVDCNHVFERGSNTIVDCRIDRSRKGTKEGTISRYLELGPRVDYLMKLRPHVLGTTDPSASNRGTYQPCW